ncbi:hypothetical protein H5410_057470, partial [Solanum commersonii]
MLENIRGFSFGESNLLLNFFNDFTSRGYLHINLHFTNQLDTRDSHGCLSKAIVNGGKIGIRKKYVSQKWKNGSYVLSSNKRLASRICSNQLMTGRSQSTPSLQFINLLVIEQTIPLESDHVDIKLLNPKALEKYNRKYNYLHFGLVQIAAKPLSREGLDTSLLLYRMDSRFLNFNDSLLGMVETSLFSGLIYFDCFPNFTVSLKDINILVSLTLNVKTSNYKIKTGSLSVAIMYRIQYKAISSAFNTGAMRSSYKGETGFSPTFRPSTSNFGIEKSINPVALDTPDRDVPTGSITVLQEDFSNQQSNNLSEEHIPLEVALVRFEYSNWPKSQKLYYSRATHPDIALEEMPNVMQNNYNANNIYEWNIDTLDDNGCHCSHNCSHQLITHVLVAGFTGQLKGWWDTHLIKEDKQNIFQSVRLDPLGNPILKDGHSIPNSTNTLIYTIIKTIIGSP